jgi:hypothetical protein
VVRNPEQGRWLGRQPWTAVEELRIGTADGGGPASFGNVVSLKVDPLGRTWVADAQASEIRVFDTEGRHVRSIGRKGGGPGEFNQISGMDWDRRGNLWVLDGVNSRYTVLDTAGRLMETKPRVAGITTTPWPGGFDRQGNLYDLAAVPAPGGAVTPALVRYDEALQPRDTLLIPDAPGEFFELVSPDGRSRNRVNVPFTPTQVWRLDPHTGDVWLATTGTFRFVRQRFSGDTAQVVEREHTPVRITSADMERMLDNFRWFTDKGGKLDRSRIPSTKPAFITMFVDDRDYLWVIPERGAGEDPAFDLFEPDGRYLGRMHTPVKIFSSPAPVVRGDYLYATSEDPSGAEVVVRLRINRR